METQKKNFGHGVLHTPNSPDLKEQTTPVPVRLPWPARKAPLSVQGDFRDATPGPAKYPGWRQCACPPGKQTATSCRMFITLTLNPTVDCSLAVKGNLRLNDVHTIRSEIRTPGGKGINVAKMLAANGCEVLAGGILGEDQAEQFADSLRNANVETSFLTVNHPTRCNIMATGEGRQELKLNRPGFPDLEPDWKKLRVYCRDLAASGDVVIMSGSLPVRFPADTYARLVTLFNQAGKTVVLDTSGESLRLAVSSRPAVIKPNRPELQELAQRLIPTDENLVRVLKDYVSKHEAMVVSDGGRGAWFATRRHLFHGAAPEVTKADTTGAGDSLLGQFCADYFPARRLTESVVANAVAAGSAAVELKGTPIIPIARVKELAAQVRVTVV